MNRPRPCLVFGGTGAVGSEICRKLSRDGAQVTFTYYKNEARARELERELPGSHAVKCDLSDREMTAQIIAHAAQTMGGLSAMTFAVAPPNHDLHIDMNQISRTAMQDMLDFHVAAPFAACQAAVKLLQKNENGANIVFIGSLAGSKAVPAPIHFAASKAALHGLVETMSKELGAQNVRVNVIAPGLLDGGSSSTLSALWREGYKRRCLLRRTGKMSEIAEVVAWFCLENTYITGQAVVVDGGL
ncbi:MAG: SDR family oxidoreductase [Deltaproteobacteria bacterium]|nr:SDR family oxidoreductase [Deltaproteobacteria bacterium]